MKKKTLIGSIFVLTLLLLMPSVSAFQQNIISEDTYNDVVDHLDNEDFKEIINIKLLRYPTLYKIIISLAKIRFLRLSIIWEFAVKDLDYPPYIMPKMPLLFFYCVWLISTLNHWCDFWNYMSDTFGWDWGDIVKTVIEWYEDNFEREI
jgi:hypothetical protein